MRGSLALYRHDGRSGASLLSVSRFGLDVPLVPSVGDPHVENFGTLRASDGALAVEPNDFDAADRAPYLWDARRLVASMALSALGALTGNADSSAARVVTSASARDIARATAAGYRTAIEPAAAGAPPVRATTSQSALLVDAFSRSDRDQASRRELTDFTDVTGTLRRLKRGGVDPVDASSMPCAGLYPPGVHHDDVGLRMTETSREAWARPDAAPHWGSTH